MNISIENRCGYFAAMNGGSGFTDLFGRVFSEVSRLYVVIGGPGTGKSRLMNELGSAAEAKGHECVYFYCSSDPSSLDGVLIPSLNVGMLDGTPPHAWIPKYPGALERIVDLGAFRDDDKLSSARDRIIALCEEKRRVYESAYRLLGAADEVCGERRKIFEGILLKDKLNAAVSRISSKWKTSENEAAEHIRQNAALSSQGRITLKDGQSDDIERIRISGDAFAAEAVIGALYNAALQKNTDRAVGYEPLTSRPSSLYIPESRVYFSQYDGNTALNTRRFVDAELYKKRRATLRFYDGCIKSLENDALARLSEAGKIHAELEAIYTPCMDFRKKQRYCALLISKILGD